MSELDSARSQLETVIRATLTRAGVGPVVRNAIINIVMPDVDAYVARCVQPLLDGRRIQWGLTPKAEAELAARDKAGAS